MPFKTKEQRNIYQKNYYILHPDKLADKRRKNIEYMKKQRAEIKELQELNFKENESYAGEQLI